MRTRQTEQGYTVIVSNEEYRLLRKIDAHRNFPVEELDDYYQELGEKLYSKSLLNKVQKDDKEYFVSLKRKDK